MDEDWTPWAGDRGYLVFSSNTGILESDGHDGLVNAHHLGAVFLTTGQEVAVEVRKLILKRWDWETIDRNTPRPFAYLLPMSGRGCVSILVSGRTPDEPLERASCVMPSVRCLLLRDSDRPVTNPAVLVGGPGALR